VTSVIGIGDPYALSQRIRADSKGDGFTADLKTAQTDALLQTTRQYDRWRDLRQRNPEAAKIVADLVVRRHALLEDARSGKQVSNLQFNGLTEQLQRHGIHLYRTTEFEEPVFRHDQAQGVSSGPEPRNDAAGVKPYLPAFSAVPLHPSLFEPKADETSALAGDPELHEQLVRQARNNYLGLRSDGKDCYNFLVQVLEDSGIPYYGRNGIRESLVNRAEREGVNPYRYLTGEDLTSQLCRDPFRLHVPRGSAESAAQVWRRMLPGLAHGALLSVSSQSFGHTGIVAGEDGRWTFLNSAKLGRDRKESYLVKEEELMGELQGWLARAGRHDSFLDITVGLPERGRAEQFGPWAASKRLTVSG
jgi:hypothetical protein